MILKSSKVTFITKENKPRATTACFKKPCFTLHRRGYMPAKKLCKKQRQTFCCPFCPSTWASGITLMSW